MATEIEIHLDKKNLDAATKAVSLNLGRHGLSRFDGANVRADLRKLLLERVQAHFPDSETLTAALPILGSQALAVPLHKGIWLSTAFVLDPVYEEGSLRMTPTLVDVSAVRRQDMGNTEVIRIAREIPGYRSWIAICRFLIVAAD